MLLALVQQLLDLATAVGVVAAAVAAVAAAYRVPVVSRPIKWLGRTLIGDPIRRAHHQSLDDWAATSERLTGIEHELYTNDGASLRDVADRLEAGQGRLASDVAEIKGRLEAGEARFARIEAAVTPGD